MKWRLYGDHDAHRLLTRSWTADVETVETAIAHFTADPMKNDCQVLFFEMDQDSHLHVNITHKYPTKTAQGWAGPADVREDSSTIARSAIRSRAGSFDTFGRWPSPLESDEKDRGIAGPLSRPGLRRAQSRPSSIRQA